MFRGLPLSNRNLIITGYTEPNKPRITQQVAAQLRLPFVDVEQQIEQRTGETLEQIRERYGERRLKTLEADVMSEVLLYRQHVIRINGSTLAQGDYLAQLQYTSGVICLVARLDAILQRMHLTLGARYHNPNERGQELTKLRREWAIRRKTGIHELDVTYLNEAATVQAILTVWQEIGVERA